ncbi:MAG: hypothetical protein V3V14_11335, partial [Saprospiraceae bacterium]
IMNIFEQHLAAINNAIPEITDMATNLSRDHFDQSFTNKGFTDKVLTKWKPVFKKGKQKIQPLMEYTFKQLITYGTI